MPDQNGGRNHKSVRDLLNVRPRRGRVNLTPIDPSETSGLKRHHADARTLPDEEHIMSLQECLHAEGKRAVLVVLQGMDTSGKDGTVRHALRGLNPQGVRIVSFKAPTPNERRHDFLWRVRRQLPRPGEIVIFNRSHYEDVLIAKVRELASPEAIDERYGLINRFEAEIVKHRTAIVKIFLHISADEQRGRLLARLGEPDKHWKFNGNDISERGYWDDYQMAYGAALGRCSTVGAPWYVIPANRKWYRNWAVSQILIETMEEMKLTYPNPHLDVRALKQRIKRVA
ncbi:MAG TPA: PPK2 family polyphosphate kinase [Dehalococcoidia bacterium]|jgi:PPK2 family polyphosphate:nucleotide phosphotransferase|nr:PPK2 family polyphosphate kinase [Dehalococcoidia bacterium]